MKVEQQFFKNYVNQVGVKASIVVTLFSILLFVIALLGIEFNNDALEPLCFFSLIVEFIYGVILCFNVLKNREKYNHLVPFLFLNWFIGCFCTNVFINVFENLPIWVYLVTFLFCLSNFFIYSNKVLKFLTSVSFFINGFSFLLIIYYAIFLIPIAPISLLGILALGLGFYGLVPMIVVIAHAVILVKTLNRNNSILFAGGMTAVFAGMAFFTIMLHFESKKLSAVSVTKSFEINEDLPTYITISQHLKPNFFNEILLKKDIVYISTDEFFEFRGFDTFGNNRQYNERKTHNPLVNIAYLFSNDLQLSVDDRINILKSNFNKRLEAEEQLWSGRDLITKNIKEDIKIYARERLAYTEITMDIACEKESREQREAIYFFQLPEGAVATSLSLWVNGIERKGVLTTKEKAENAYRQIVSVEARDPSLMQWKEGNKVVVRVFPITHDLPRTFKCGFTTPLKVEGNEMKYKSLNIKGPNISNAETVSRIQMDGNEKFKSDKNFELKNNFYINESTGLDNWQATIPLSKANAASFAWKEKVYEIRPIQKEITAFTPSEIILDLDNNWELEELKEIVSQKNKKYYVYINNKKREVAAADYKEVFSEFRTLNYSLLPLFKLPENSLVITKSGTFSANFEELQASNYLAKLKEGTKQRQLKVINISEEINPFWQTVKEQKYVEYLKTDLKSCIGLINKNQFIFFLSAKNSINIEPSHISIEEKPKVGASSNGSNHIYRMYAFGKVLEEQVKIQGDSLAKNQYVYLAKEANIVTPISSLIVLETDADYEKNGIEKNVNTLGNAAIKNDGAVPEPHEWLLIILGISLLLFYYRKSKKYIA